MLAAASGGSILMGKALVAGLLALAAMDVLIAFLALLPLVG
jgi:hypothetical protein